MAEPAAAQAVLFHRPKAGSSRAEWEDCGGYFDGDPAGGHPARYVVVDGATEAYDALRWVRRLVESFLGVDGVAPPALTVDDLDAWFARMQRVWLDEAPAGFASIFEEHKFRESGSMATFVGCEVHGLGGGAPTWSAAALGDSVLFHLRDGRPIDRLPRLGADDFGLNPGGVSTQPEQRARMRAALRLGRGRLRVGDQLLVATDALAEWLIRTDPADPGCWRAVATIGHPADFARFVRRERAAGPGRLKNDDVTLLRVDITPADADVLVVCR
jgi:hypothetical protein